MICKGTSWRGGLGLIFMLEIIGTLSKVTMTVAVAMTSYTLTTLTDIVMTS